jgi:uncharacterized protein (DUF427 family)
MTQFFRPKPAPTQPGQESVWNYPRPAIAEPISSHLKVIFTGVVIAETRRGIRTLETSHPPCHYFPPEDVAQHFLARNSRRTHCEWKGRAFYVDLAVDDDVSTDAGWCYASPTPAFASLAGMISFYAGRVDACFVDGERVVPQQGEFYGGWITSKVAGPFKGVPDSMGW